MDSFELNKIIGAILGTLLFVMGAGFLAEALYHPIEDRGPGYALPEPEVAVAGAPADAAPEVPLGVLLASASAEEGAKAAKKCQSCHDFTEGGPNKTGPNLYDVVERPIGSHEGFAYSEGMAAHHAAGDIWSYENLNAFITAPKAFTPGTKMNFGGVKSPEERANILAYLATLSGSPKPFPVAEAVAPTEEAAPTGAPAAETPATTETPAATEAPAGIETPAPAETTIDTPASETTEPAPVETPTTTQDENAAGATPVTTTDTPSTPAAPETPAVTETPAAPATTETPATTEAPAATETPAQ